MFHKNDLLFVGIGSTVGKIGIVSDEIVSSNQQITGFTIDENMLDVQYLYYYLKFNKDISIADQSKTTLPIVNQEKIKQIPIVVPSVELQRKIVNEINEMEEKVVDHASAAATIAELEAEIRTLKRLEKMANDVRVSGIDRKWDELSHLLQDNAAMFGEDGQREKLIIFTEHKDTLNYLASKIRSLFGND